MPDEARAMLLYVQLSDGAKAYAKQWLKLDDM